MRVERNHIFKAWKNSQGLSEHYFDGAMVFMPERMESAESEEAGSDGRATDGDGDGRASQLVEMEPSQPTPSTHSLAVYDRTELFHQGSPYVRFSQHHRIPQIWLEILISNRSLPQCQLEIEI